MLRMSLVGILLLIAQSLLPDGPQRNPIDRLMYVYIPPGSFQMGCSARDEECSVREKPSHPVKITKGFWMSQTEVTLLAYQEFADATGAPETKQPGPQRNPVVA